MRLTFGFEAGGMAFGFRNMVRCALVIAVIAIPPTAGCRNWYRAAFAASAVRQQTQAVQARHAPALMLPDANEELS